MDTIEIWRCTKKEKEYVKFHKHSANRVGGIDGSGNNKFFILFNNDTTLRRIEADNKGQIPGSSGDLYFDGFNALRKLHKYAKSVIEKRKFLTVSWQINIEIKDIIYMLILVYLVIRSIWTH